MWTINIIPKGWRGALSEFTPLYGHYHCLFAVDPALSVAVFGDFIWLGNPIKIFNIDAEGPTDIAVGGPFLSKLVFKEINNVFSNGKSVI